MKYGVLAAALALGCFATPANAQSLTAGTKWVNERGSELTITSIDTATGALSGILDNGVIAMDWETILFNPQLNKSVRAKGSDVYSPKK
jgi:hypothetical protein